MAGIADQFKGLPMSDLIGQPLLAAAKAQGKLSTHTQQFINDVGLSEPSSSGGAVSARSVDFGFKAPVTNSDGSTQLVDDKLSVPLLSILNVQYADLLDEIEEKKALEIFDVIQTLDREKLAHELIKHKKLIKNKKFFIQLNVGKEKTKSGILPEEAIQFVNYCKNDLKINVVGLMCIPPFEKDPEPYFLEMKKIAGLAKIKLLSMGMSSDFEVAIKVGADYIRIGTALFGSRRK